MIITGARETYDGQWRIVAYEPDGEGKLTARLTRGCLDAEIPEYYLQREEDFRRLHAELLDGRLSPIGFHLGMSRMTLEDVAARMRLRQAVVRRHTTPEGFRRVTVDELDRYARMWDLTVADFFQIARVDADLVLASEHRFGRLLQLLTLTPRPAGAEPERR